MDSVPDLKLEHVRLAVERLRDLSATIGPNLLDADWHRRREVIRTLVQKVEIGHENVKIVFRVSPDAELIDVAGISLYLGVKLCDATLGSRIMRNH